MDSFTSDRRTLNCTPEWQQHRFVECSKFAHIHICLGPHGTPLMHMVLWSTYKVLQNPISTETAPQLASCFQTLALTGPQAFITGSHQDDRPPDVVSPLPNRITPLPLHFQSALIGPNRKHYRCEWCYFLTNELLPRVSCHNTQMGTDKAASSHKALLAPRTWLVAPGSLLVSGHFAMTVMDTV